VTNTRHDAGKLPTMITEDQLHLLTAAVDAELSPSEAQSLRQLLESSAEARAVFSKLKADSNRLHKLPRVAPPPDLHKRVMAKVAALTPPPKTTPSTTPSRRAEPAPTPTTLPFKPATAKTRRWVPVAVAASLLLGIAGSSFWFFTRDHGAGMARNPNRPPPATRSGASDPAWANWLPAEGRAPSAPMPSERNGRIVVRNDGQPPIVPPVAPDSVALAPEPRTIQADLIGSRIGPDAPPFDLVQVRVPFLRALSDFDREDVRQQLTDELARDPAFRIDLFARDPARGVEWFQKAAKAAGLTVHADSTTMNLLKQQKVTSVVVYTESLTAAELTDLFTKLNVEDAKISPRVFDVLHATPVAKLDESDLRSVLGTDPGLFKRAMPAPERGEKGEKGIETGRPISAGTADQIVKSITTKAGEKSAVLMTWAPSNARTAPANSAELKSFLSKRGERKPNAVPVVIVIRHGNG